MSFGRAVVGASGAALLFVMFLPWFGGDQLVELPGVGAITAEGGNRSAWQSFAFIDLLLFAVGVLALAHAFTEEIPPVAVIAAGTFAVVLIVYRMIDPPSLSEGLVGTVETSVGRRIGVFFGLLAATGIALGGYLTGEVESRPRSRQSHRGRGE